MSSFNRALCVMNFPPFLLLLQIALFDLALRRIYATYPECIRTLCVVHSSNGYVATSFFSPF